MIAVLGAAAVATTLVLAALVACVAVSESWWLLLRLVTVAVLAAACVAIVESVAVAVSAATLLRLVPAVATVASTTNTVETLVVVLVVAPEASILPAAAMVVLALMAEADCAQTAGDVDPSTAASYGSCEHREQALCPAVEYFPPLHAKQAPEVTAPVTAAKVNILPPSVLASGFQKYILTHDMHPRPRPRPPPHTPRPPQFIIAGSQ
jgi:hypothetical protein